MDYFQAFFSRVRYIRDYPLVAFIVFESKAQCIYVSSRRFQFWMKRRYTLAKRSQFESRECITHRGNKWIFLPTMFWEIFRKSFDSFMIHLKIYAPRGAIYTAPIGPYPTCTWFPYDSYLINDGKGMCCSFQHRQPRRTVSEIMAARELLS